MAEKAGEPSLEELRTALRVVEFFIDRMSAAKHGNDTDRRVVERRMAGLGAVRQLLITDITFGEAIAFWRDPNGLSLEDRLREGDFYADAIQAEMLKEAPELKDE